MEFFLSFIYFILWHVIIQLFRIIISIILKYFKRIFIYFILIQIYASIGYRLKQLKIKKQSYNKENYPSQLPRSHQLSYFQLQHSIFSILLIWKWEYKYYNNINIFVKKIRIIDKNMQNYQESDNQQLLSQRMKKINEKCMKCISIFDIQQNILIEDQVNQKSNFKQKLHEKNMNKISTTKSSLDKQDIKSRGLKKNIKQSSQQSQKLHYQSYKVFQIRKNNQRQRKNIHFTQLKDTNIKEHTGYAMLLLPNMRKYEGQWVNGTLVGQAKIQYPNKTKYVGKVYRYKKHGFGVETKQNGQKYVGQFCYGEYHGQGKLYNKDGELLYDGQWKRGQKYLL